MTQPRLEVAEVFRQHEAEYLAAHGATAAQRRVLHAVQNCRTAVLGGHVEACDHCDHQRIAYNSCRNRHCPKCQGPACARWMQAREAELLPVPYFHLVFTLPGALAPVALQNPQMVYAMLLKASAQTLLEVAADPKHLGAEIGVLAVLHTWGQNLLHHPHVHCVVPAGGLAPGGDRWIACRKGFFLSVRVLSRVFRGKFVYFLKQAFARGELRFHGSLAELAKREAFEQLLDQAVRHDWVVYAKRPFGGPAQVLKYLARYTHRVAISNRRLVRCADGQVAFRWKDYARGGRQRVMALVATEFIRRFLLHVLPRSFVKIRHYGLLANRFRTTKLEQCRRLLHAPAAPRVEQAENAPANEAATLVAPPEAKRCPCCGQGRLRVILHLQPLVLGYRRIRLNSVYDDTS